MRLTLRSFVSGLLSLVLVATIQMPASAVSGDQGDPGLSADSPSTFDLPDGGEAVFNPTDPNGVGAIVEVTPVETTGDTATTADGTVRAIGDGVDISATSPSGEDIATLQHEVTIIPPADEDSPTTDEMTPAIELTFPVSADDIAGIDLATLGVYSRESAGDPWTWVPSAYDPELGAVVAQSDHLSEFTVMGAPAASEPDPAAEPDPGPALPKIALDPDDLIGKAKWNGVVYNELQFSAAVASGVKTKLEDECSAEVLITRDASTPIMSRTTRSNLIRNFDADIAMTLAFNNYNIAPDGIARPWGVRKDGGVVAWSANNGPSIQLGNNTKTQIVNWTGRSNRRPLNPPSSVLPYPQLVGSAPAYAHAELLFLDHNFDWPYISTRLDLVIDAVYSSIIQQIEATPGIACAEPVTLPTPPTQDELDSLVQMGYNNYQTYGTDPVNLSTGNYVTSEDVFSLTGVGDQKMDLALAYNALDGRASPVGNGWSFAYGSRVQRFADGSILATLADGRRVNFTPDGVGGYVANSGGQASLTATADGVEMAFPDGTTLEFTVDEVTGYGELTRAVDRQGNAYTLAYGPLADASGGDVVFPPLLSITDEAGQTIAVTSTPQGEITAFTHPDGRVWHLAYDASDNLISITDGAGRTRSFEYNGRGLLSVVTGADGVQEITNAYDDKDRVVTQTDGAGNVRTIAYSEDHSTTLTDALGNASTIDHNAKGQAVASHDAEGGVTLTGYDSNYNPTESIDANGNVYHSTFDAFGRVLTSTSPLGAVTSYTYNATGDLTSITAPDANGGSATMSFVLNSDGRAIETHLPDGTVTYATYDAHGDVTSSTDALGNTTTYQYDACGNTVAVTDALGGVSASTYDLANRATSTTDALGNTTTLAWNAADNLVSATDALGQVTTFAYDANDSLVSQTDARGFVTTYEYNVNLQLTAVNLPDGTRVTYAYDAEHHLILQTNADGTTRSWEYDGLGRANAMVDENGGRWVTQYDAIGNPLVTIDPLGNQTETTFDVLGRPTDTSDALGQHTGVTYNPLGLVTSLTDELGRTTSYDFDVMGRLLSTTRPDGTTTSSTYDANGQVVSSTDARGNTTVFENDAVGRLTATTDPLGHRSTFEYDGIGNVTATTDPLNARTEYVYDALANPVVTTDALGGDTNAAFDPTGNVLTVTDALGNTQSFTYDPMGRLATSTAADGGTTTFAYDAVGNLVTETNPLGAVVRHEYDGMGSETARIDQAGQRWLTEYNAMGDATAVVDPTGARSTTEYDAIGQQVASTDALGNRTERTFDAVGSVTGVTNALGDTTTYAYDAMNRLASVTTPQGATAVFGYDVNGNSTSVTNALGDVLETSFDAMSQPVLQVDPDGGHTALAYDAAGNLVSVTDQNGATQRSTYDALGRTTSSIDGEGFVTAYAYDAAGNVLAITDPRGGVQTSTYDSMNRVVGVTDALGATTTTAYDLAGNVVSTTDPVGAVTRYQYDARNLLTSTTENYVASVAPSASVNVTTGVTYDARGLASSVTDARGNATVYVRDGLGQLTATTDPLGRTTRTEFDALGRTVAVTAPDGSVIRTSYTPDGNVAQVAYPGQTVSYTYDAGGNRVSMTDNLGTSSWVYDWAGRVVSETDARGKTTTHTFDAAGNLVGLTYPDGRTVARTFDDRGLALTQTDTSASGVSSIAFAYDEVGGLVGEVRSSGVSTAIERDLVGRVTSLVYTGKGVTGNPLPSGVVNPSSGAPGNAWGHCKANGNGHSNQQPAGCTTGQLTFAYAYDARGFVTQRDVTTGSTAADAVTTRTLYAHDALGRLTRSVTGAVVMSYGWDAASNMVTESATDDASTSQVGDAYAVLRTVDAVNELVTLVRNPIGTPGGKVATTQFSYDERGNQTGAVATTVTGNKTHVESTSMFVYDSMDQLTSTTGPDGSASWVRDGAGRALTVTEDGATSNRLYDGFTVVADCATQLTVAPDGSALSETTTTTTIKGKVSTTSVASVDTLTDALGSTVATASNGVISADLALYGDFGDVLTTPKAATSSISTVTGFTGKVSTAGLVEFAFRTYDPATRVWVQDDRYGGTVLRASSMNRYAYVEGAPETYVDAWGLYRARAALQAQALAARNAAFQSAIDELNQVVGSQARLGGGWTVNQMMASYNQFHASDDPVVRAAMDQIARQAFYGVWDLHYQQKVQAVLAEQAQQAQTRELLRIQAQYRVEQEEFRQELAAQWLYNTTNTVVDAAGVGLDGLKNRVRQVTNGFIGLWNSGNRTLVLTIDSDGNYQIDSGPGAWQITPLEYTGDMRYQGPALEFNEKLDLLVGITAGGGAIVRHFITRAAEKTAAKALVAEGVPAEVVAVNSGSRLAEMSDSAFSAADNVGDWAVSAKHLPNAGGNWSKWAPGVDVNQSVADALRAEGATFWPNPGGMADSFIVRTEMGTVVGTKGQTVVKVVVSNDGHVITAYPGNWP